jgi:prolyl-tRNA synthetase
MADEAKQEGLTVKKADNFSEWYTQVVQKAELADIRYNVKGFIVFRPWSVLAMDRMFELLEARLQSTGHMPALFPAVIPESNFKLESEHVKGFLPDVFWVTEAGSEGKKIEERLALRPTSETAIYKTYSEWIRSWRDMPLKIYQRCQVWRYETKATRPFIRSREFYWIESHDVFATEKEAMEQVKEDMETTEEVIHKKYCIPFLFFERPEHDKFPGAVHTYAADTLMPDGKVLQLPSTHLLGQNFSKPFNIKFVDRDETEKYAWQTCYGPAVSRIIAAVIAIHGDDKGLVMPPAIAPLQVIIVPIYKSEERKAVIKKAEEIGEKLKDAGVIAKVDERSDYTPGWKFNHWELRGVPIRLEIGPRDIKKKQVVIVRRDTGDKAAVSEKAVVGNVMKILDSVQDSLVKKADAYFKSGMHSAKDKAELKKALEEKGGLVRINWCGDVACADTMKAETSGGVIRGTLFGKNEKAAGKCMWCGKSAKQVVYVSKQY